MAVTEDQIAHLRRIMPTAASFTDEQLSVIIADEGSIAGAAAQLWESEAARTAGMVDVEESGSSRKMSQLSLQASKLAAQWRAMSSNVATAAAPSTTRLIVRS